MSPSDRTNNNLPPASLSNLPKQAGHVIIPTRPSYSTVSMSSILLLALDLVALIVAASLSTQLYSLWLGSAEQGLALDSRLGQAAFIAAVIAPFMLHDRRFGSIANVETPGVMMRSFSIRFSLFSGVILALGALCQVLGELPRGWLPIWFVTTLLLASLTRMIMVRYMRRLQRRGALKEVVAIVGAGPLADRLVQTLSTSRPGAIELLGIFDDKVIGAVPSQYKSCGNVAALIELGKTRKIDWILLTLPPTAEHRVLSIVQRLKALSAPIGLCPQHVGLHVPYRTIDYVGGDMPVNLLAERPEQRWDAATRTAKEVLPRWIITLALLPFTALGTLMEKLQRRNRAAPLALHLDNYDVAGFAEVAAHFGQSRFGYAVTPNADHIIRLHEDASFRALYATASYVLLDSRFLAHVLRLSRGIRLPVCTGSDLTIKLFADVIAPDDSLVLIGGSNEQALQLQLQYGLRHLAHFNPPMGFVNDPEAVETCLQFVEANSPFRFCLLALGAPQQEAIAQQLKQRGIARGLALCIGASVNFLTGDERRAPAWMQRSGTEWLYRLVQAPGRMAKRYLVRGPRVFALLRHAEIMLRTVSTPTLRLVTSPAAIATTVSESNAEPTPTEHGNLDHPAVNCST